MGAGLAAAGRPLGATVEVRLQRHGARRVEEQCQNDTVQILFFLIIIIIIIIIIYFFLFVGTQKWVTKKTRKKKLPASFRRYFPLQNTICNSIGNYLKIFLKNLFYKTIK